MRSWSARIAALAPVVRMVEVSTTSPGRYLASEPASRAPSRRPPAQQREAREGDHVAQRMALGETAARSGKAARPVRAPGDGKRAAPLVFRAAQGQRSPRLNVMASKGRMQTGSSSLALAISTHRPS